MSTPSDTTSAPIHRGLCRCGHYGTLHGVGCVVGCSYVLNDGEFCPCEQFRSTKYREDQR
jgi:hypothetical protein